ncbi:hypothetical protein [Thalassotalea sp. G2M2-11]|uniref:hypothetical protein n=1 Tax=Thalassotalea sp. G2M2-11 TaxID=2787627 RepID=UPI0019CFC168|nr:hypothetical protein [Thalassotalea sp. G2M2-11]
MNELKRCIFVLLLFSVVTSAAEVEKLYDFDHQLHYKQQRISDVEYHIEVLTDENRRFNRLATFLLRHAYHLCQSYQFNLQILDGIEQFDDRRISPNYIQPSLSANLVCPKK